MANRIDCFLYFLIHQGKKGTIINKYFEENYIHKNFMSQFLYCCPRTYTRYISEQYISSFVFCYSYGLIHTEQRMTTARELRHHTTLKNTYKRKKKENTH